MKQLFLKWTSCDETAFARRNPQISDLDEMQCIYMQLVPILDTILIHCDMFFKTDENLKYFLSNQTHGTKIMMGAMAETEYLETNNLSFCHIFFNPKMYMCRFD